MMYTVFAHKGGYISTDSKHESADEARAACAAANAAERGSNSGWHYSTDCDDVLAIDCCRRITEIARRHNMTARLDVPGGNWCVTGQLTVDEEHDSYGYDAGTVEVCVVILRRDRDYTGANIWRITDDWAGEIDRLCAAASAGTLSLHAPCGQPAQTE